MANRQKSDDVVLELITTEGAVYRETVSKQKISAASEYLRAFFEHSALVDDSESPLFRIGTPPEERMMQQRLLRFANGEPLELTEKNVARGLVVADRWHMETALSEIAAFLKSYLETEAPDRRTTREPDSKVSRIVQVLKFLSAAAQYGVSVYDMDAFVEIQQWCYQWLCRKLPSLLASSAFSMLPDEVVEEVVTRCKQKINPKSCVRLWDKYRAIAVPPAAAKLKQAEIAEELKEHCMNCILAESAEVMQDASFKTFLRGGWNGEGVSDLMRELVRRMRPQACVHFHEALLTTTREFEKEWIQSKSGEHSDPGAAAVLACLNKALESVTEYRERYAIAIAWSEAYEDLKPEARRQLMGEMRDRARDGKTTRQECAFVRVNDASKPPQRRQRRQPRQT